MLCVECHRHFDLSFQDYTSIKKETISEIQGIYVDPAFLQFLQADLDAYRLSKCNGQLDACPWISPTVISRYLTEAERSTLPSYELETWDSPNHATYLRESAEKGCDMCLRICEGIDWLGYEYEDISINSSLQLEPVTLRPVELIIEVSRDDFDPRYLRFGLLEENTTTDGQVLSSGAKGSKSVNFLDTLIACLSECSEEHVQCRDTSDIAYTPSRLIDLRDFRTSGEVNIVSRNEAVLASSNTPLRYTALSHIWGRQRFLTLLTSNRQELQAGFQVSRLPKTFEQAIAVTDKIGLRYLWIDSLCIVQDSEEDWLAEAGAMDKVYLNSYCTFAASLATSPHEGLFWNRRAEVSSPFVTAFTSGIDSIRFTVFLDLQYLILTNAPLYKRGWVLQESYLSPRTMHFSKFPAFECRELFACECYRTARPKSGASRIQWLNYTTKTISFSRSFSYDDWWEIIHDYSQCNLTVATDKLIALCGIAKTISSVIPGGYYAGIWEQWWLHGLLWVVNQGSEANSADPLGGYIAPSWSWASVDAPIQPWMWNYKIMQTLVKLQSISTTPANGDPFGQLTGGDISLKGKLFSLPDFRALSLVNGSGLPVDAFSLDRNDDSVFNNRTFFLPLVESLDYMLYDDSLTICGLLLQFADCVMSETAVFRRVGFTVISNANGTVGRTSHRVLNWTSPPWSEEDLGTIVIV